MPKLSKFKVVLVGDQNVGKTSVISRFIHDSFEFTANPTVGIDFVTKTMQIDGETLRLQLWDTAGQQRFRSLIPSYVRDADACLIIMDVAAKSSFEGLQKWLDFVRESRGQDALIFLVGNKSDVTERETSKKQLQEYADLNKYPYIEVSARNGSNIHLLFRKIAQKLIDSRSGSQDVSAQESAQDKDKQSKIVLNKNNPTAQQQLKKKCQC